jgi:hypothetical protein
MTMSVLANAVKAMLRDGVEHAVIVEFIATNDPAMVAKRKAADRQARYAARRKSQGNLGPDRDLLTSVTSATQRRLTKMTSVTSVNPGMVPLIKKGPPDPLKKLNPPTSRLMRARVPIRLSRSRPSGSRGTGYRTTGRQHGFRSGRQRGRSPIAAAGCGAGTNWKCFERTLPHLRNETLTKLAGRQRGSNG